MPRLKTFYKQLDYPDRKLGTCDVTLATNGCYVTSAAMVASSYGEDVDPIRMNDQWTSNGLYVDGCDATDQLLPKTFPNLWLAGTKSGVTGCQAVDVDGDESAIVRIDGAKEHLGTDSHFVALDHCEGDTVFAGDPLAGAVVNLKMRYGDSIDKVAVYRMERRRFKTMDVTRFFPTTPEEQRFPGPVTHIAVIGPDRRVRVTFMRPGEDVGANSWDDLGGDVKSVSIAWVGLDLVVTGQGRDDKLFTKRFTSGRWVPAGDIWNATGVALLA